MWKNLFVGILGLWIILLPFLGMPLTLMRTFFIITGIAIAVLGFWSATDRKSGVRSDFPSPYLPSREPVQEGGATTQNGGSIM